MTQEVIFQIQSRTTHMIFSAHRQLVILEAQSFA